MRIDHTITEVCVGIGFAIAMFGAFRGQPRALEGTIVVAGIGIGLTILSCLFSSNCGFGVLARPWASLYGENLDLCFSSRGRGAVAIMLGFMYACVTVAAIYVLMSAYERTTRRLRS